MKLNQPERNVIVILDPGDFLSSAVEAAMGEGYHMAHARDAAAFQAILAKEQLSVALLLAMDEAAPCDTLALIAAHRDAPWFTGAPSLVFARTHDPAREALAEEIGIQDYVGLSSVALEDCGRFIRLCIAHELRLAKKLQRLRAYARRDGVTGLYNHAAAEDAVTRMLQGNPGQEFLFAILDIDYFKQVNDVRGHEFGDRVLVEEAGRLTALLAGQGLAIRYGGDEFMLLMPLTDETTALAQAIHARTHFTLEDYRITNSIGIATTLTGERTWASLFRRADRALYAAKENGRNQFCIHSDKMPFRLDGAAEEIRSGETLNLGASPLVHALVNGCAMACHLDLHKVAIVRLAKLASGEYGWSDPIEYIPFINSLLERVEEKSRLRFSEFINPNTLASRLRAAPMLAYAFTGVDGKSYRVEYIAGDADADGHAANALMLLREMIPSGDGHADIQDDVPAIERCLASGLTDTYNAIWIIHPATLSRELVSIQTDISRHRRINRLFEGGNYWEDTQGYVHLYVNEDEQEGLLRALHPDVLLREVEAKGMYALRFHRRIDGVTLLCEYCFTNALYNEERVILQLYRRVR